MVSTWAGEELIRKGDFKSCGEFLGAKLYKNDKYFVLESNVKNINAEFIDKFGKADCAIFLSAHSSSKGVESFTAHSEGNWSSEASLGGVGKRLSMAAPLYMLAIAKAAYNAVGNTPGFVLEATHHGPLLDTPSVFLEFGGSEKAKTIREKAEVLADISLGANAPEMEYSKIVIGIGGPHYAYKFTKLELSKGYAFAHILPKHYCSEVDMLGQAFDMSKPRPESAVIEWKSIKAETRNSIIRRLEDSGVDYEKV
ncbi:MAG: D-aminoacyl-tRNA deacylase [Candidatus Micrarchaeaceae archaeon]